MTRLIDADELLERSWRWAINSREAVQQMIEGCPTIDAVPVKRGEWRFVHCATGLRCQCSECLHWVDAGTDRNHCPNCGARMDKDD